MPRDGAVTLADVRAATLEVACERCGRYGRYNSKHLLLYMAPTPSCRTFWRR
jgi:hypothetical protein